MSTRSLRRRALVLVPLTAGAALLSCGGAPTTGDMRDRAREFIEDDLDGAPDAGGVTFEEADCQEPDSTEPSTAFVCTATGSDGQDYTFTVTIVGRNRLDLVSQPRLPGRPTTTSPGTTAPAGAPTTGASATATVPATTGG